MNPGRWRAIAFGILLAWMLVSPIPRQVLNNDSRWFRDWAMFRSAGIPVVDARFYRMVRGQLEPLERPAGRFESDADVLKAAQALCTGMGPDADVRVKSRLGGRGGWTEQRNGAENLCVR